MHWWLSDTRFADFHIFAEHEEKIPRDELADDWNLDDPSRPLRVVARERPNEADVLPSFHELERIGYPHLEE